MKTGFRSKPKVAISNKDRQIQQLPDEAIIRDQQQSARISELQNLVHEQSLANGKLQQMLESTLRVPLDVNAVQTDTSASAIYNPLHTQTAKAAPHIAPPGISQIEATNLYGCPRAAECMFVFCFITCTKN